MIWIGSGSLDPLRPGAQLGLSHLFVGDIFGHEIVTPMAIVMLGGLVTSTLFTLFIVPALYLRFAPAPEAETPRSQLSISQREVPGS